MAIQVELLQGNRLEVEGDDFAELVLVFAPNLSQEGVFVETDLWLSKGSDVSFELRLNDGFPLVRARGQVAWRHGIASAGRPGLAIRFEEVVEGRNLIERIVDQYQLDGGRPFRIEPPAEAVGSPEPSDRASASLGKLEAGASRPDAITRLESSARLAPGLDRGGEAPHGTDARMTDGVLASLGGASAPGQANVVSREGEVADPMIDRSVTELRSLLGDEQATADVLTSAVAREEPSASGAKEGLASDLEAELADLDEHLGDLLDEGVAESLEPEPTPEPVIAAQPAVVAAETVTPTAYKGSEDSISVLREALLEVLEEDDDELPWESKAPAAPSADESLEVPDHDPWGMSQLEIGAAEAEADVEPEAEIELDELQEDRPALSEEPERYDPELHDDGADEPEEIASALDADPHAAPSDPPFQPAAAGHESGGDVAASARSAAASGSPGAVAGARRSRGGADSEGVQPASSPAATRREPTGERPVLSTRTDPMISASWLLEQWDRRADREATPPPLTEPAETVTVDGRRSARGSLRAEPESVGLGDAEIGESPVARPRVELRGSAGAGRRVGANTLLPVLLLAAAAIAVTFGMQRSCAAQKQSREASASAPVAITEPTGGAELPDAPDRSTRDGSPLLLGQLVQQVPGRPLVVVAEGGDVGPPVGVLERISWTAGNEETRVEIWGDGTFRPNEVSQFRLNGDKPREVVRVPGIVRVLVQPGYEVATPQVQAVRSGYHAEGSQREAHVVIDLAKPTARLAEVRVEPNKLVLVVRGPR